MNNSLDKTADELSVSTFEHLSTRTVEELRDESRGLENKIALAKDFLDQATQNHGLMNADLQQLRDQQQETKRQILEARQRIDLAREKRETAKQKKALAKQAGKQRAAETMNTGKTRQEMEALRDKLEGHRYQKMELEKQVDDLQQSNDQIEKMILAYRSALKEKGHELEALKKDRERIEEHRGHIKAQYEGLVSTIDTLKLDAQRLQATLDAPFEETDQGKSLFDEVFAEKKTLEEELMGLIEHTNSLRHQVRQKQEEIDELQSHEHENLHNVDIHYVLAKVRQLADTNQTTCEAMQKTEKHLHASAERTENLIKATDEKVDLGAQYLNLRDYSLNSIKVVNRECEQGLKKFNDKFFELESMAAEYNNLQDRMTNAHTN